MRPTITSNAGAIALRMRRRRQAVTEELSRAARTIGAEVHAEAKRILIADIYSVPIPAKASTPARYRNKLEKGGEGRWQRSHQLLRRELFRVDGPVVYLTNDQEYAIHRYRLGLPGRRQPRSPGVKSVQWQQEAVQRKRGLILRRRREAVLRALRRR